MANEISMSVSFTVTKSGTTSATATSTSADLSGDAHLSNVQAVGTSWEAINIGDVASPGYIAGRNQDETNFVQFALANDDSGVFAKVLAGKPFLIPVATGTIYAKADTASCNIAFVIC